MVLEEILIKGDGDLLNQVWLNLIHNGIKFTPPGGKIQIGLIKEDEKVKFSISDSGIGINSEDQMHIFERFYKADKSRTPSAEGSGLGLAIAKKIIDLHQGKIHVESQPGRGTTFTVLLP